MKYALKWVAPCDDGQIWYVSHTSEPELFQAKFSKDSDEAFEFNTLEEARAIADLWKSNRGRKPKVPRPSPFEIVERE